MVQGNRSNQIRPEERAREMALLRSQLDESNYQLMLRNAEIAEMSRIHEKAKADLYRIIQEQNTSFQTLQRTHSELVSHQGELIRHICELSTSTGIINRPMHTQFNFSQQMSPPIASPSSPYRAVYPRQYSPRNTPWNFRFSQIRQRYN